MKLPTVKPPITTNPNLSLVFTSPGDSYSYDSVGNPVTSGDNTLTVKAIANASRKALQRVELPGLDENEQAMLGYLVNPKVLPNGYELKGSVVANVLNPDTGAVEKTGKFTFQAIDTPYVSNLHSAIGTPFAGVLSITGGAA